MVWYLLLLHHLLHLLCLMCGQARPEDPPAMVKPGCPEKCGKVTIPYPFGFQDGCSMSSAFHITCNTTSSYPKPYLLEIEIMSICPMDSQLLLKNRVTYKCYDPVRKSIPHKIYSSINLSVNHSQIAFSTMNSFVAVGCDTIGLMLDMGDRNATTGCVSFCNSREEVHSGDGCCTTHIPVGLNQFFILVANLENYTNSIGHCSYAFLGDKAAYNFSARDLTEKPGRFIRRINENVPIRLDWAIDDKHCGGNASYASAPASLGNVTGSHRPLHVCRCKAGFQGNPYLQCLDVDECQNGDTHNCIHVCRNTVGSYICSCPSGYYGDGLKNGTQCNKRRNGRLFQEITIGICASLFLVSVTCSWLYWGLKKRRLQKLREDFFKKNGGLLLQQQLSSQGGSSTEAATIFSLKELEKATNNFDESHILGKGGYGTVYKGTLADRRTVAIKKSHAVVKDQIEQFINEVVILSQVYHRNVVRVLGCCLEASAPILVYEYIPNGTLFQHIHGETAGDPFLSWDNRLRIAGETADALAYLHSSVSMPIFHRDVKSDNILLDETYTAKVSDFGVPRLVSADKDQVTTLVMGTMGYLDPEYLQTSHLTDRSDVYSFGIVLMELITGRLAISFEGALCERNLASHC